MADPPTQPIVVDNSQAVKATFIFICVGTPFAEAAHLLLDGLPFWLRWLVYVASAVLLYAMWDAWTNWPQLKARIPPYITDKQITIGRVEKVEPDAELGGVKCAAASAATAPLLPNPTMQHRKQIAIANIVHYPKHKVRDLE